MRMILIVVAALLLICCVVYSVGAHNATVLIDHSTVRQDAALLGDTVVYAAPHRVAVGEAITPQQVEQWLRDAGEVWVDRASALGTGTFAYSPKRGELESSPHNQRFPKLQIRWRRGVVEALTANGAAVPEGELEPEGVVSYVHASDGSGKPSEDRQLFASAQELAASHVPVAEVGVEDKRYYKRKGALDLRAMARSAVKCALPFHGRCQGASTIWGQLSRQAVLKSDERTVSRKLRESFVASKLASTMTKDQGLLLYTNSVFLGDVRTRGGGIVHIRGYKAAAEAYFGKSSLSELTWAETAAIEALAPRPQRLHDPKEHEKAFVRVLKAMHELDPRCPSAAPFPKMRRQGVVDISDEQTVWGPLLSVAAPAEALSKSQDKDVYLAASSDLQRAAIHTLNGSAGGREERFSSLIVLEPSTGHVLALAGAHPKNMAVDLAVDPLPWGSLGKPFVTAAGIDRRGDRDELSGVTMIPLDEGYIGNWPAQGDRQTGWIDERAALASSNDAAAIAVGKLYGFQRACEAMRRAFQAAIPGCPSTSLLGQGRGVEAKPLEIVAGFGALVAGGRRTAATFLINRSGSAEQIMSREASYMVLQMLRSTTGDVPADVRGTFSWGKQAMGLDSGSQVAAKTGTTDDRRSLWIVGLFKDLAVLVVVSSNHSMPAGSQGASVAGPLLARFVREARSSPEAWRFAGGFDPPPTVVQKSVDRRSGCELPDGTDQEWFPLDRLPPPCSYLQ